MLHIVIYTGIRYNEEGHQRNSFGAFSHFYYVIAKLNLLQGKYIILQNNLSES